MLLLFSAPVQLPSVFLNTSNNLGMVTLLAFLASPFRSPLLLFFGWPFFYMPASTKLNRHAITIFRDRVLQLFGTTIVMAYQPTPVLTKEQQETKFHNALEARKFLRGIVAAVSCNYLLAMYHLENSPFFFAPFLSDPAQTGNLCVLHGILNCVGPYLDQNALKEIHSKPARELALVQQMRAVLLAALSSRAFRNEVHLANLHPNALNRALPCVSPKKTTPTLLGTVRIYV